MRAALAKIFGIIVSLCFIIAGATYNRLLELKMSIDSEWAYIKPLIYQRAELVPKFASQAPLLSLEQASAMEKVMDAYLSISSSQKRDTILEANFQLGSALDELFKSVEGVDNPRYDSQFHYWRFMFGRVEPQLISAAESYNRKVEEYNRFVQGFPGRIIARLVGFEPQSPMFVHEPKYYGTAKD